jgi:hypothetical protein
LPSDILLKDWKRIFKRYGIWVEHSGEHAKLVGIIEGREVRYPFALKGGRYVKHFYLDAARRHFSLTAEDGYPDEDFRP